MFEEHHAYLVVADSLETSAIPRELTHTSTDVLVEELVTLSIADARKIISLSYQKPIESTHRVIVIKTEVIASEAQHALLKILEDPPLSTKFILVLPTTAGLLPTLLSRVHIRQSPTAETCAQDDFLTADYAARLERVNEETKKKDPAAITDIFSSLESYAATNQLSPQEANALLTALEFKSLRGSSKKMLLEHLALSLPIQKT